MRLIDADKLFLWLKDEWKDKYPVEDGKQYDTLMIYEIKDEIDNAETVDAIPVEWITKWIMKKGAYTGISGEYMAIADMVEDWVKENDR